MNNLFYKLWYFKKHQNSKLEEIFQKKLAYNHNLYDSYFEKKLNSNSLELFKEHYNNFKPSLDELKTFDKSTLTNLSDLTEFVKKDLVSLFERPYLVESRENYFRSSLIEPDYPNLPIINEYKLALSKMGTPTEALKHASDFFRSTDNSNFISKAFVESRVYINGIQKHPEFSTVEELLATLFRNLDQENIEVLLYYVTNHEAFSLVTLEPYMISVLGNALFFKIFLPLHKTGAFKYTVNKAIIKQQEFANTFENKMLFCYKKLNKLKQFIEPVFKNPTAIAIIGCVLPKALDYIINSFTNKSTRLTTVSDMTKKALLKGEGYTNSTIESIQTHADKTAFTVGQTVGSVAKSFVYGFLNKHEDSLLAGSKLIDDKLTEKRNKK